MTVFSTSTKIVYEGNGLATSFPFPFKVLTPEDIELTHSTDGVEAVLSSGYTVVLNADGTGSVLYPTDGSPLALGETLVIRRKLTIEQPTDLNNQGGLYAETLETAFDRQAMISQQLAEEVSRAVKIPLSETMEQADYLRHIRQERARAEIHATEAGRSAQAASASVTAAASFAAESAAHAQTSEQHAQTSLEHAQSAEAWAQQAQHPFTFFGLRLDGASLLLETDPTAGEFIADHFPTWTMGPSGLTFAINDHGHLTITI